jgi:hypothetical protein
MATPLLTELFYDPLKYGYKFGQSIGPIGGHSDHVHLALANARAMVYAMRVARNRFGLHVGENPFFDRVDPVHTTNSYHYRTFGQKIGGRSVGEAADISGARMADFARWALQRYGGASGAAGAGGGGGGGGGAPQGGARFTPRPIRLTPQTFDFRTPAEVIGGVRPLLSAAEMTPMIRTNDPRTETLNLEAELRNLRKRLLTA